MEIVSTAATALTIIAALLCARALYELRRSAPQAGRFAVYSMIAAAMFLPIILLGGGLLISGDVEGESKAFLLGRAISLTFNCAALDIPIGATAFVVWIIARRRARVSLGKRFENDEAG